MDYKNAYLIFYSQNEEELHEIVQTHINTLSYNMAWDFKVIKEQKGIEYKTTVSFKPASSSPESSSITFAVLTIFSR